MSRKFRDMIEDRSATILFFIYIDSRVRVLIKVLFKA